MPNYLITGPDGKKYKVTGPGSADEALAQVRAKAQAPATPQLNPQFASAGTGAPQLAPADPNAPPDPTLKADAAARYKQQMDGYTPQSGALTEGSEAGLMAGFDDEIGAGMMAPIEATKDWFQGNGFDLGRGYNRIQKQLDLRKDQRREAHPVASIAGEIAGGLGLGGMASVNGATLFGRAAPLLAAPAEGAVYGGLYGAGEAKPGHRMEGVEQGSVGGALTGLALHGAGKAAEKLFTRTPAATAPAVGDLADEASQLYTKMGQSGVTVKPAIINRLKANIGVTLAGTNARLAPKSFGIQKLANQTLGPNAGIGELHNFAKAINQELRARLEGADAHYLPALKSQVENLIDQGSAIANIPGNKATEAFQMWKQADGLWAKYKKATTIQKIMDLADVDGSGRYTQSGLANAVRRQMNTLYKSIKKGTSKGWSPEEIALIRQMAKGGSNSTVINLLAKFAPRGVISTLGGFAAGGPGLVAGGYVAGHMADKGAATAATALRDAVARGYTIPPMVPQIASKLDGLVPGLTAPANERRALVAR